MSYFDPDITFELSRSTEVCPFEVSLELIEQADVIVCDYNYIFDPYVGLKAYQQDNDYGDCVLIVDEAHNLVDRGRGYYSPELSEKSLDAVRNHLASRNCWVDGWEELLELLLLLQRRRRQRHEPLQRGAAVGVEANVVVARAVAVGRRGAGEIERTEPVRADRRANRLHHAGGLR